VSVCFQPSPRGGGSRFLTASKLHHYCVFNIIASVIAVTEHHWKWHHSIYRLWLPNYIQ